MKADITRDTFRKEKHFEKVTMQQGRVQIDADWNEQADIHIHRSRTSTRHTVGRTGAPKENPGFNIQFNSNKNNPPYYYYHYTIGKGCYYVDGILCENENQVDAENQPDLPLILFGWDEIFSNENEVRRLINFLKFTFSEIANYRFETIKVEKTTINREETIKILDPSSGNSISISLDNIDPSKASGAILKIRKEQGNDILICNFIVVKDIYDDKKISIGYSPATIIPKANTLSLIYLDVWEREVTWLDDPHIREIALGGLDTATRTKIVWQVKAIQVNRLTEGDSSDTKLNDIQQLQQRQQDESPTRDRIQTQQDQKVSDYHPKPTYSSCYSGFPEWTTLLAAPKGTLQARLKPTGVLTDQCELPQESSYRGAENQLYRVEIYDKDTFKWSRDNGVVVSRIKDISETENKIILEDIGKDNSKFGYPSGSWVEITDDRHELWGIPGSLVQVAYLARNTIYILPETIKGEPITAANYPKEHNAKIRRWDSVDTIRVEKPNGEPLYIDLENDIQIGFGKQEDDSSGLALFKTGDYWLIPARRSNNNSPDIGGRIEWPQDQNGKPLPLPPQGIVHHLCKLALISSKAELNDCRQFFLPLNHLTLRYVSGDGQEGSANDDNFLPVELKACIRSGDVAIEGVTVMFEITKGGDDGMLSGGLHTSSDGKYCYARSDKHGFVSCKWKLADGKIHEHQQVRAIIVEQIQSHDKDDKIGAKEYNNYSILVDLPVYFNASITQSEREHKDSPITEEVVIDFTKQPRKTLGGNTVELDDHEILISDIQYRSTMQHRLIPALILVGFVSSHSDDNEDRTLPTPVPKDSEVLFIEEGVISPSPEHKPEPARPRSRATKELALRAINIRADKFDIKIEGDAVSEIELKDKIWTLRWWAVPCEAKK